MRDESWFTGNATIFRRSALLSVGGFPEELGAFTDGYVSRLLTVKYGSCYTPEVLVAWRQMEGGLAWACAEDGIRARSSRTREKPSCEKMTTYLQRATRNDGSADICSERGAWRCRLSGGKLARDRASIMPWPSCVKS
jgi:hypothetical protein